MAEAEIAAVTYPKTRAALLLVGARIGAERLWHDEATVARCVKLMLDALDGKRDNLFERNGFTELRVGSVWGDAARIIGLGLGPWTVKDFRKLP